MVKALAVLVVFFVGFATGWFARNFVPVVDGSLVSRVDTKKFEPVYRAAKLIQGSIEVGVTYDKFGDLLQDYSAQIMIAKDLSKSEQEKTLLDGFTSAFSSYQDSYQLWAKIQENIRQFGGYPKWIELGKNENNSDMHRIIKKYGLNARYENNHIFVPKTSIQLIWRDAQSQLDKVNPIFLGMK